MSTIQAIFTVMCLPRRKIAPVSVTCRLSLSMLYVFLFVLHVVRNVNSLLVYDRQTLLDLRSQPIDRSNFDHKDYGSLPRSVPALLPRKTVAGTTGADSVFPSRGNCSPRLGMNMRNLRPLCRALSGRGAAVPLQTWLGKRQVTIQQICLSEGFLRFARTSSSSQRLGYTSVSPVLLWNFYRLTAATSTRHGCRVDAGAGFLLVQLSSGCMESCRYPSHVYMR